MTKILVMGLDEGSTSLENFVRSFGCVENPSFIYIKDLSDSGTINKASASAVKSREPIVAIINISLSKGADWHTNFEKVKAKYPVTIFSTYRDSIDGLSDSEYKEMFRSEWSFEKKEEPDDPAKEFVSSHQEPPAPRTISKEAVSRQEKVMSPEKEEGSSEDDEDRDINATFSSLEDENFKENYPQHAKEGAGAVKDLSNSESDYDREDSDHSSDDHNPFRETSYREDSQEEPEELIEKDGVDSEDSNNQSMTIETTSLEKAENLDESADTPDFKENYEERKNSIPGPEPKPTYSQPGGENKVLVEESSAPSGDTNLKEESSGEVTKEEAPVNREDPPTASSLRSTPTKKSPEEKNYIPGYMKDLNQEQQRTQVKMKKETEMGMRNLSLAPGNAPVYYVTGSNGGCGKSTFSFQLAYVYSHMVKSQQRKTEVWLIETDWRNPKLERRLNIPPNRTLKTMIDELQMRAESANYGGSELPRPEEVQKMILASSYKLPNTNLRVVACPYALEKDLKSKYIFYSIIFAVGIAKKHAAAAILDAQNVTKLDFDDTDRMLLNKYVTKALVVTEPGHTDDVRRSCSILAARNSDGKSMPMQNIKVFTNKSSAIQSANIAKVVRPIEVIGRFPFVEEISPQYFVNPKEQAFITSLKNKKHKDGFNTMTIQAMNSLGIRGVRAKKNFVVEDDSKKPLIGFFGRVFGT